MRQQTRWTLCATVVLACLTSSGLAHATDPSASPNILLILIDDLGSADFQAADPYASPADHHPYVMQHLNDIAARGVTFPRVCLTPNCQPTRASILTGLYPTQHNITRVQPEELPAGTQADGSWSTSSLTAPESAYELDTNHVTIAEVLEAKKDVDYSTHMVGKWHLGEVGTATGPRGQGFDVNVAGGTGGFPYRRAQEDKHFWGHRRNPDGSYTDAPARYVDDSSDTVIVADSAGVLLTDYLTQEAKKLMGQADQNGQPFFTYLSYYAIHNSRDFSAPPAAAELDDPPAWYDHYNNYQKWLSYVDDNVNEVWTYLEDNDLLENTYVFITSDNGGNLTLAGGEESNEPFRAGKASIYEGGVRLPMIVHGPDMDGENGHGTAGTVNDMMLHAVDFFPTLAEIAGATAVNNYPADELKGKSFKSLLDGSPAPLGRDATFQHFTAYRGTKPDAYPASTITKDDGNSNDKLIYFWTRDRFEWYDLDEDEAEENNLLSGATADEQLYNDPSATANRLAAELREFLLTTDPAGHNIPTDQNGDSALLKVFYLGDMNRDQVVNGLDVDDFMLAITNPTEYESRYHVPVWTTGDGNADGRVDDMDADDFVALVANGDERPTPCFHGGCQSGSALRAVPEPSTGILAALSVLGILLWARRAWHPLGSLRS